MEAELLFFFSALLLHLLRHHSLSSLLVHVQSRTISVIKFYDSKQKRIIKMKYPLKRTRPRGEMIRNSPELKMIYLFEMSGLRWGSLCKFVKIDLMTNYRIKYASLAHQTLSKIMTHGRNKPNEGSHSTFPYIAIVVLICRAISS